MTTANTLKQESDEPIDLDAWDPEDLGGDEDSEGNDGDTLEAEVNTKMDRLRTLYVESSRDAVLAKQFKRLLAEKDSDVDIRRWAGLLVIAPSGAGKTRMIKRFLQNHPRIHRFGEEDTDFINIDVPSPVTNKSLGLEVLRTMYPQQRSVAPSGANATGERSSGLSDIWHEARTMANELGVWGLWVDEAHDLRNGGPKMLEVLQSTLKRWMAHEHRPILILSGTPEIENIFLSREIRRRFLSVASPTLSADTNTPELRRMIAQYLREVELGIDASLRDIMPRLVHAGTRQIGWTLDVVLEAIRAALLERASKLALDHFAESYADIIQCADHENPFLAEDWAGIDTVLHRSRKAEAPSPRKRRRKREETPW